MILLRTVCPPLKLAKTDDGPSRGLFFFWFQRDLVVANALFQVSTDSIIHFETAGRVLGWSFWAGTGLSLYGT